MHRLHIPPPRLPKPPLKPPRRPHRRNPQIKLRIRHIQSSALPRPSRKRNQIPLERGIIDEAFGFEFSGGREKGGVIVDEDGGHGDGGHGWDGDVTVAEDGVGEKALHAVGDAVADAEAFGDDGAEVRELFQLGPFGLRG